MAEPTVQFDALEAAIKLGRDPRVDSTGFPTLEHLRKLDGLMPVAPNGLDVGSTPAAPTSLDRLHALERYMWFAIIGAWIMYAIAAVIVRALHPAPALPLTYEQRCGPYVACGDSLCATDTLC